MITKTYETPSPSNIHPVVIVLNYRELYDMIERLAKRRAQFIAQIEKINKGEDVAASSPDGRQNGSLRKV